METRRIPELDGLRGIAILLVLLYHLGDPLLRFPIFHQLVPIGWSGVDLFFVLSGFLIGGNVLSNRDAPNFYYVFYARRALRIFPLYYGLIVLVAILTDFGYLGDVTLRDLLFNAIYAQNVIIAFTHNYGPHWLQPTWSLAVEEHFYLLLPAAVALAPRRLSWLLNSSILLALATRLFAYSIFSNARDFAYFFTICRLDDLSWGVLLVCIARHPHGIRIVQHRGWDIALIILLVSLATLTKFAAQFPNQWMMFTVGLSMLGPMFSCALVLAVWHKQSWVAMVTRSRLLHWFGLRAYGLYLFHMPFLNIITNVAGPLPSGAVNGLALAFTLVAAAISWRYVEHPLIRLGHGLGYDRVTVQLR